ncbi:MAG TPA: hypothetical protein VGA77_09650 [Propylenella sp.]
MAFAHPNLPGGVPAVVGVIDPDVLTATTHDSTWVDMRLWDEVMAVVMAGTLGASATLDAAFRQATDSSGTSAKVISPAKGITQLTAAGTDSDKQAVLKIRSDELDHENGFYFVGLRITVAVASSDGGALLLGLAGRFQPGTDLAAVDEIVT